MEAWEPKAKVRWHPIPPSPTRQLGCEICSPAKGDYFLVGEFGIPVRWQRVKVLTSLGKMNLEFTDSQGNCAIWGPLDCNRFQKGYGCELTHRLNWVLNGRSGKIHNYPFWVERFMGKLATSPSCLFDAKTVFAKGCGPGIPEGSSVTPCS